MRRYVIVGAATALLVLSGCSDSAPKAEPAPTAPTLTSESADVLNRECRLAATAWADILDDLVMSGRFSTAGGLGIEQLDVARFDGPRPSLKVDCPSELLVATSEAEYQLALANAALRVCVVNEGACDMDGVNKNLDAAEQLGDRVSEIIAGG